MKSRLQITPQKSRDNRTKMQNIRVNLLIIIYSILYIKSLQGIFHFWSKNTKLADDFSLADYNFPMVEKSCNAWTDGESCDPFWLMKARTNLSFKQTCGPKHFFLCSMYASLPNWHRFLGAMYKIQSSKIIVCDVLHYLRVTTFIFKICQQNKGWWVINY